MVRFMTLSGTPTAVNAVQADVPESLAAVDNSTLTATIGQRDLEPGTRSRTLSYEYKKRYAKTNADNGNAPDRMRKHCATWLNLVQGAADCNLATETQKESCTADDAIGRVVSETCNLLIGTLNSMAREGLDKCAVDTVIIDECAQGDTGDVCIPLNTFRGTMVCTVLCGDDHQLSAVPGPERSDEAAPFVGKSVFGTLRQQTQVCKVHLLNMQYQFHPHFYHWPNEGGGIKFRKR